MAAWRYSINYGPEGEANYAMVYDDTGALVSNLKTHHAVAVVAAMNVPQPAASDVPHDVVRAPAAWAYEYHDFGDVWARAVVLNRPDGGANPPTAHHGSQVRNVRPLFATPAPSTSTEAKCFECDGPLHGPYCPACRPTEEALRAENARLREILGNANNLWRHEFSKEVEDAADKLFKRLSWNSPDGARTALSALSR